MTEDQPQINEDLFDKEVGKLLKQCIETITTRYKEIISIEGKHADLASTEKYTKVYNRMKPNEHIEHYETLYNANRRQFLSVLDDDKFLRNGNLYVSVLKLTRDSEPVHRTIEKQARIPISNIYRMACELRDAHIAAYDGYDGIVVPESNTDELRPQIILLHLFRIFYHIITTSDQTALGKIVTTLESNLGVKTRTVVTPGISAASASDIATGGGLSSLFTMATSLMSKMGLNPPENIKPPSESEITNVISQVFNSQHTQNAIQGMMSSLQGCNDFESAVGTVIKSVSDPATMEAIQASVVNATGQNLAITDSTTASTTTSTTTSSHVAPYME